MICTLGNFSTKLLTALASAASRACTAGRRCTSSAGGLLRVYPIFHPAAALRSTKTLEELREDFARLPALLAEPPPVPMGAVAR